MKLDNIIDLFLTVDSRTIQEATQLATLLNKSIICNIVGLKCCVLGLLQLCLKNSVICILLYISCVVFVNCFAISFLLTSNITNLSNVSDNLVYI